MTQSADLDSASDFIAGCFQSDDLNQIRCIFVQAAVETKFTLLLKSKLGNVNIQSLDESTSKILADKYADYQKLGFELIQNDKQDDGFKATIVKCPRSLIADDDLPIVTLEVFRTTKEVIAFAKSALSIGLWCENLSITFELINALPLSRQIWLNASHGVIHPKLPFFNGQVVCEDTVAITESTPGFAVQVADNIQFQTTFRGNSSQTIAMWKNAFQTVVIPFGESFAN